MQPRSQDTLVRPHLRTRLRYQWRQWINRLRGSDRDLNKNLNDDLLGYPTNHTYQIRNGEMIAQGKVSRRWRMVSPLYPLHIRSFLDVGCCKGYFVCRIAQRSECERAVGIDLFPHFVDVSQRAIKALALKNAQVKNASIEDVAANPSAYGGPFDLVQVISTYHYIYWGSKRAEKSMGDHDSIMNALAKVCSRYVVFMNPLEISDCPLEIQKLANPIPAHDYTREGFLSAAQKHFDVFQVGLDDSGKRPIMLLVRH
jgi:SAM-dependent methyltransferase